MNGAQYPILQLMARDYLTIPGGEVSVERLFSGGRDILGIRRHSLGPETFRMLMILKISLDQMLRT